MYCIMGCGAIHRSHDLHSSSYISSNEFEQVCFIPGPLHDAGKEYYISHSQNCIKLQQLKSTENQEKLLAHMAYNSTQ